MSAAPVVIIGGTGVFGSRLARLLARDGHCVVIAARQDGPARLLAAELGADVLLLDRAGDLAPLFALHPRAVIDAAGPFHAYGDDPYRLPRACIAAGIAYLDLADDAGFCAGISDLDAAARAAGVPVWSGVSSVPALSGAAVAALSHDMDEIGSIDIAILPGNRAPRGRSVMASILGQLGTRRATWIAADWTPLLSWSAPRRYALAKDLLRTGCLIEVPDTRLLPKAFGAGSVTFRAGLELPVMNAAMRGLSWVFAVTGWRAGPRFVSLAGAAARLVEGLGSDRGGMVVEVTGRVQESWKRRRWTLVAEAGEGPFIPAVPARAVMRDLDTMPPGAGPATRLLTLDQAEHAMADLQITTTRQEEPAQALFPTYLHREFQSLPKTVRATHARPVPQRFRGRAEVTRGTGLLPRVIATIFRFPKAAKDVALEVTKHRLLDREIWDRRFGDNVFRSTLRVQDGRMTERFGPITFVLNLHVEDRALHYPVMSARIGPIPIPSILLPLSVASERADQTGFCFDVALYAPLGGGKIVQYRGRLDPFP